MPSVKLVPSAKDGLWVCEAFLSARGLLSCAFGWQQVGMVQDGVREFISLLCIHIPILGKVVSRIGSQWA